MKIKVMNQDLTVCKVAEILTGMLDAAELYFVGKTDEELSLVCETQRVPERTVEREDGWKAFRIEA